MGRYDHLKSKPRKKADKLKIARKIILVILLLMAAAGIIIQVVMQNK